MSTWAARDRGDCSPGGRVLAPEGGVRLDAVVGTGRCSPPLPVWVVFLSLAGTCHLAPRTSCHISHLAPHTWHLTSHTSQLAPGTSQGCGCRRLWADSLRFGDTDSQRSVWLSPAPVSRGSEAVIARPGQVPVLVARTAEEEGWGALAEPVSDDGERSGPALRPGLKGPQRTPCLHPVGWKLPRK